MKNLILTLSVLSLILTACGDDKATTTTTTKSFPTYSSVEDCNDIYLNRVVTTDNGKVSIGIPGNTDCPYKKKVRSDLFVEAYTGITKARDAFSIGNYGFSANVYCDFFGCWSYKTQCPPEFKLARDNSRNPVFGAYAHGNLNYGGSHYNRNYANGYNNRHHNNRVSRYDDLPTDKTWCEPMHGSRWYDEWVNRNGGDDLYL